MNKRSGMNKYFLLFVCFTTFTFAFSQPEESKQEDIFDVVEEPPVFPGGMQELYKFIGMNFYYPDTCKVLGIQGKVYVSFVIEKDGSIGEARVLRGVHPALDEEALRVVKIMPKWTPGRQRGKLVRVRYNLPIVCKLQ